MKKNFLILFFAVLMAADSFAQVSDIGLFLGFSKYKGELSNSLFTPYFLRPAFGAYYRYNTNRHWAFRIQATIGSVEGDDSQSKYDWEVNRNLSFHSEIQEVAGTFEFNFLTFELGNYNYAFTPFMYWGLSVFHFNPKAEYKGQEYDLRDLCTEGQETYEHPERKKYSLLSAAMPFGGGFKFNGEDVGFTIEIGARRAWTDYLDDVSTTYPDKHIELIGHGPVAAAMSDRSLGENPAVFPGKQRGNENNPDWYMFGGVTAFISIGGKFKYSCRPFHPHRISY